MVNRFTNQRPDQLVLYKKYAFAAINFDGFIKLKVLITFFNYYQKESIYKDEDIPLFDILSRIDEISLYFKQGILLTYTIIELILKYSSC